MNVMLKFVPYAQIQMSVILVIMVIAQIQRVQLVSVKEKLLNIKDIAMLVISKIV